MSYDLFQIAGAIFGWTEIFRTFFFHNFHAHSQNFHFSQNSLFLPLIFQSYSVQSPQNASSDAKRILQGNARIRLINGQIKRGCFANYLHNVFCSAIETGYGHIFFHLTHLFVDLHFYADVRVLGIFSQELADAKLEVAVRAARGNAHGPVYVAEARCPVSSLK